MTNRIKELRRAAKMTLQSLADRMDLDRSTIWRYENGEQPLFTKVAIDLARVLGARKPDELLGRAEAKVPLIGSVGAGAQIFPLDDDNEWLEAPPGVEDCFAVQVVGRSMLPVYRPDDILYCERRERMAPDVIGKDCVVQVTDGPRLVKRVLSGGAKGLFRLYSYDTQDETDDLALDWAAPVRWISR